METENKINNNNNNIKSKWGTWEELVLGSAVKKHGADNWDKVSLELQARKLSPYVFSSEDCKVKYHALQGRFKNSHGNSCSNSMPWLEELRKLRVAQLKRELERYDGSIVSLESKLKKLKTEREQSLLKEQQKTAEKLTSQEEQERSPEEEGKDGFQMCPETDPSAPKREDGKIESFDNPNRPLENPDPGSGNPNEDLGSKEALVVHDEIRDENPHGEQDLPLESAQPPSAEEPVPQQPDEKTLDKEPAKPETISVPASPLDSYYGSSETIAKEHPNRMGSEQEEEEEEEEEDDDDNNDDNNDNDRMGSEPDDDDDENDAREQVCVESTDVHSETVVDMKGSGFQECSAESREIGEEDGKGICEKRCDKGERLQPWDSNDVLSSAELSTRRKDGRKSSSTSHDASETVRGHYKEYEDSMGAWQHQATRSSGDSQVEGTDEMSPMSKRSRREAKVPGKLLPLLECLRAISAHKFGSIFKHRLESQDNLYYQSMIRRHVDLAMVRLRLEEGSYSGSVEFFRDLLLVFNNALVYYSKYSQEFVAAYVLRELATKEMATIFQTEALLKQEGPSTRKREPRKIPEFSLSAKPNPTPMVSFRKRNANTSYGEYQVSCPKSAHPTLEQSSPFVIQPQQAENRKEDETKDDKIKGNKIDEHKVVEISASPSMTQILEKQREQKIDAAKARTAANSSAGNASGQSKLEKFAVESKERIRDTQYLGEPIMTSVNNNHQTKKTTINNKIELKKGPSSKHDLEKNSSDLLAPMKSSSGIFRAKKSTAEPIKSSSHIIETNKTSGNIAKPIKSSNTVEQERISSNAIRRSRELKKNEQQDNLSLKPPLKQPLASTTTTASTTQAQPLLKRGVGRPPKHAKQASQQQKSQQQLGQKQQVPELKATDSELLLPRPRKRSRT